MQKLTWYFIGVYTINKIITVTLFFTIILWLSPSAKQHQNPCFGSPPVYKDLSTCLLEIGLLKAIVDLSIKMKGKYSKQTSSNLLSPLGLQKKDITPASKPLLTKVKLH